MNKNFFNISIIKINYIVLYFYFILILLDIFAVIFKLDPASFDLTYIPFEVIFFVRHVIKTVFIFQITTFNV